MKILSIDPGLRKTGFAVLEKKENQDDIKALTFGVIKSSPKLNQSSCLVNINDELSNIIKDYKPEVCAVVSLSFMFKVIRPQ